MRALDLIVIGAYMAALVGIGFYFARRQRTTEEYFVAGRSVPGWAMGLSLLATIITSVTFIAYPGAAYAGDWSLLVPGFLFVATLGIVGFVVVPFFRSVVRMSAYEYFGQRFGSGVRLYASATFAVGHFSKMGFVFYLLSLTLGSMTGWPVDRIIFLTAAVTVLYTLLGGVEAVVWSDVLQGFVLWLGILVSLGFLLFLPKQGPMAALALPWHAHKISLGSTALRFDKPTIIVLVLYGFFFYLQKYTADQTFVQRYLLARTDRSALRGITLGAALCLPVWAAFMLIGSLLWSFYRLTGEALPTGLKPDQVFPHFLVTHIPPGLAGLFIAALLGSAMAMLASDMNCLAVIGVEDFFALARPRSTDRERLRVGKILVVVSGFAAAGVAELLAHTHGSALALYYTVTAIVAGGLAGLFLLAFLVPRATKAGAVAGILASLASLGRLHGRRQAHQPRPLELLLARLSRRSHRPRPAARRRHRRQLSRARNHPPRRPHAQRLARETGRGRIHKLSANESPGGHHMNRLHRALAESGGKPLLGAALYFYDPIFLELSALMGYKVIWIEMEHGHITFAEAADLCRMAAGLGVLTMIRIVDTRRENILKACECGPDMIDVPMVDTPETAAELVHLTKYPPLGGRGVFGVSRSLRYGLFDNQAKAQEQLNEELSLLVQIETKQALARIEEIAAVPGVDLFIGPADLAASLGFPGETAHPTVQAACALIIETARKHGKKTVTACAIPDFAFWTEQGIDVLYAINDISALRMGARTALDAANKAIADHAAKNDTEKAK